MSGREAAARECIHEHLPPVMAVTGGKQGRLANHRCRTITVKEIIG
jgi:hypothetical protein